MSLLRLITPRQRDRQFNRWQQEFWNHKRQNQSYEEYVNGNSSRISERQIPA